MQHTSLSRPDFPGRYRSGDGRRCRPGRPLRALSLLASVWLLLFGALTAGAQTVNVQNTQNAVDSRRRSSAEIDPVTLGLQLRIPLGAYPGRGGAGLPVTLNYSSKLWRIEHQDTTQLGGEYDSRFRAKYGESSAAGWTSSLDFFNWPRPGPPGPEKYDLNGKLVSGTTYNRTVARMYVTLPDGSRHELRRADTVLGAGSDYTNGTFYSVDGSRLRYESASKTLFMPDGSRLVTEEDANGLPLYLHYVDRNGNRSSYNFSTGQWTDNLGRALSSPLSRQPVAGQYVYSLPGVGGTSVNYTFIWKNLADALQPVGDQTPQLRYKGDRAMAYPHAAVSPNLFTSFDGQSSVVSDGTLFNPVVLSQIVLPDNTAYTFKYNVWGEIVRVDLPTGGYETFAYGAIAPLSGQLDDGLYSQANRGVTQHVVSDGVTASTWTYETVIDTSTVPYRRGRKITAPAPDLSYTVTYYHDSRGADIKFGFDDARVGRPYDERAYSPSGQMLRRTLTWWDYTGPVPFDNNSTATRDARPQTRVELLLDTGGDALAKTTAFAYDSDLNVTSTTEYGFVSVSQSAAQTGAIGSMPTGPKLRKTEATYLVNDPSVAAETRGEYRARGLVSLPTSTLVRDAADAVVARTEFKYDEPGYYLPSYGPVTGWADPGTLARGNPTTVRGYASASSAVAAASACPAGVCVDTHTEYDLLGNVTGSWDGNGNKTQTAYSPAFAYAYPTSVTTAAPNAASVTFAGATYAAGTFGSTAGLTSYSDYDPSTGLVISTTDANGKTTTYDYSGDPFSRLKRVDLPDGGRTSYDYVATHPCGSYVETRTLLDTSGREAHSWQFFDGLGRPYQAASDDWQDPSNPYLRVDTLYDSMGRVSQVSDPYRTPGCAAAPSSSRRLTTTGYDALGRVKSVTTADGASVTSDYSGSAVTVNDQHAPGTPGHPRRSVTDALGRLTRVDEPDAATGALDDGNGNPVQPTYYTYDALGNLRRVEQGGQLRFFMYDSLSRLIRAKNPEQAAGSIASNLTDPVTGNGQWSAAYGYDANGNLTIRYDARDVRADYAYDALNRNIVTHYSGGGTTTPEARHYYDNAANGKGRLYWTEAVGVAASVYAAYDPMGRPTVYHQVYLTGTTYWGELFTVTRAYNKAGGVTSQTYPSQRTVTYNYDAAGRPGDYNGQPAFSGNLGGGAPRAYSSEVRYHESGGRQQERFGTDTPVYNKSFYNSRNQLAEIRVSTYSILSPGQDTNWNRGAIINHYSNAQGAWGATGGGPDNNGNLRKQEVYVPNDDSISGYFNVVQYYGYDALNRLTSVEDKPFNGSPDFYQAYTYDRWGNRTINAGSTWNAPAPQFTASPANNRLAPPAGYTMGYDAAGNLTYDNYTGAGTRAYDAENRMTSAQDSYGQTSAYAYDVNGRRVIRQVAGGAGVWQIYGMGGELVAEYAAGASPTSATPQKEYGYRGGELLVTAAPTTVQAVAPVNLALGKAASQVSTYSTAVASRAVDGNTDGNWNNNAVTHTATGNEDWWEVDLGAVQSIQTIRVWNRTDCCGDRLSNFYVFVSDVPFTSTSVAGSQGQAGVSSYYTAGQGGTPTQVSVNRSGRYVRVQLTSTGIPLSLAEVEVWGTQNLSQGRATAQSSTLTSISPNGDAWRAVDGSTDGGYFSGSVTHTGGDAQAWWQVDLGSVRALDRVEVWNRTDCCAERLTDFYVLVSDAPFNSTSLSATLGQAGVSAYRTTGQGGRPTQIQVGRTGRYVRVQLAGTGILSLAEVRAWGGDTMSTSQVTDLRWLVADQLGTPRMIVDKTGSLAEVTRHDYLPFGEELGAGVGGRAQGYGAADSVRQQFTKMERDAETRLDYFLARYYSSTQGRFTSVDPGGVGASEDDAQSWNGYAYARNNPLAYRDPDGQEYVICDPNGKNCKKHYDDDFRRAKKVGKAEGYIFTGDGNFYEGGVIIDGNGNAIATYQQVNIDDPREQFAFAMSRRAVPLKTVTEWMFRIDVALIGGLTTIGPVGPGACFVAGTPVHTREGVKSIEEVKAGDTVLSYNENTREAEYKVVVRTYVRHSTELLEVNVEREAAPLRVTPEHPFYARAHRARDDLGNEDDGEWTVAGNLRVGDEIRSASGEWIRVERIEHRQGGKLVYNFEVADNHNYFVGQTGLLVHNQCGWSNGLRDGAHHLANHLLKQAKEAQRGTGQKSGESGSPFLQAARELRELLKKHDKDWMPEFKEEVRRVIQEYTRKGQDTNHPYK